MVESLPTYGVHYYPVKVTGSLTIKAAAVNMVSLSLPCLIMLFYCILPKSLNLHFLNYAAHVFYYQNKQDCSLAAWGTETVSLFPISEDQNNVTYSHFNSF